MLLDYYNHAAVAEEACRRRAGEQGQRRWKRWERRLDRYLYPTVGTSAGVFLFGVFAILFALIVLFVLALGVRDIEAWIRWLGRFF